MNKLSKQIDLNIFLIYITIITIYILPTRTMIDYGLRLDQYMFAFISTLYITNYWIKTKSISISDIIMIIMIVYFIITKKSISHIHLISILVLDKMIIKDYKIKEIIIKSKVMYVCLIFIFVYSCIYFGYRGRYIYTGLREINQDGFSILLLFIIIRKRHKIIGTILIFTGLITLSKSYLVGMILYFINEIISKEKYRKLNTKLKKMLNLKKLMIVSVIILILLSKYFTILYDENKLEEYGKGINRYLVLADYSNYFRFTVNTNLFSIYELYPEKMITGMNGDEFIELNKEVSFKKGVLYRAIKPHNYFFSYISTYGIFALLIFTYISKIFAKVTSYKNIGIFLIIFSYMTFLGIGSTSYWLYISIFTMIAYKD